MVHMNVVIATMLISLTQSECTSTDGMHLGGGITVDNAKAWLDAGAEKVIVTSYLFPQAKFSLERLQGLCQAVGKQRLVVDVR